jgi:hypothetical protein
MLKIQILSENKVSQKLPMATAMATACKFRNIYFAEGGHALTG